MKNKFLLLIVLFGLLLRVVGLSQRPMGFTWDEAALGYNAYSLLQTGRDEHGKFMPLIFKSFGDFKPGLYIYFTVLPVKLLGLSEFSTRLPSAIFGTLSILLLFTLTISIFKNFKIENLFQISNFKFQIGLIAALLLAINPVAIHFSRAAWESNLNLFLLLLISNLFLKHKYYLSAFFSALTLYAYQGAKLNTPFLLLVLFLTLKPKFKLIFNPFLLLLLLVLPVILVLPATSGRLKVFSVFSYTRSADYVQNLISQDPPNLQSTFAWLFHSEKLDQLRGISQRFLNHLSPRYLFIEGNWTDRRQTPSVYYGNFHLLEVVTILLGAYILIKNNIKLWFVICVLVIGFILPSALSRDIITTVRSLPLVIPLTILSAIGLAKIFSKKIYLIILIPIFLYSLVYFSDLYFRHTPYFHSQAWLSPYQQAVLLVSQHQKDYSQIYFTDKLGQPYIYFLFYTSYPPGFYQQQNAFVDNPFGDVGQVAGLDKIKFSKIYWPSLRSQSDILVVGDEYELPEKDLNLPNLIKYGDIRYPDGQIGFRIVGIPKYYAQNK